jgi:flagellar protein FliO/FliZ
MSRSLAVFVAVAFAWTTGDAARAQTPYAPTPGIFPEPAAAAPLPTSPGAVPTAVPQGTVQQTSHQQSVALSPPEPRANAPLQLPGAPSGDASRPRGPSGFSTMITALVVVLGLFLAVVGLLRRGMPKPARMLPKEAVEVLGRIPLPGRCQGHLIRVGNKIALVGFNGGHGEPLVEVTDPIEVDRLAGLCMQDDPHSATTSFRGIVEQFFREKNPAPIAADRNPEADDA